MGPALEIFLLLVFGLAVVAAVLLVLTRPLWKRAIKVVMDTDRQERAVLEEKARERAHEAECRRRAEEELQRVLKGEDVPRAPTRKADPLTSSRDSVAVESTQAHQIQAGDPK